MKIIQPLLINGHQISPVVVSTVMGPSGNRIFGLPSLITDLWPAYRKLRRLIWKTGTTIIAMSSTFQRLRGYFQLSSPSTWENIQRLGENGLLNAYGLANPGVEASAKEIARACQAGYNVIPSFCPFADSRYRTINETLTAITVYLRHLGAYFWALELKLSCSSHAHGNNSAKIRRNMADALACVQAIRQAHPHLCLIGKISVVHPYEFAQELIGAGVNIIHAVDAIPYDLVYPHSSSPLAGVGGGEVSGGPALEQALKYNSGLRRLVRAPIIMGCGITGEWDVDSYRRIGANAVGLCTICGLNPRQAVKIIRTFAA